MVSPTAAVPRAPGLGTFTCCSRSHVIVDANGVEKTIPCKLLLRVTGKNPESIRSFIHFLPQVTKTRLAA